MYATWSVPVLGWGHSEPALPGSAGGQPAPADHPLPAASLLPVHPTPPAVQADTRKPVLQRFQSNIHANQAQQYSVIQLC